MDLNAYLAVLATEATTLASAAEEAGLAADVPTCPGWTVSDLVLHIGEVHRWATAAVAGEATKLSEVPTDFLGPVPDAADAIDWFRDGADEAVRHPRGSGPVGRVRRLPQRPAHTSPAVLGPPPDDGDEHAPCRCRGRLGRCTGFAPDVAIDGIDEFLTGFLPDRARPFVPTRRAALQVAPDYSDRRWTVSIGPELPVTTRPRRATPTARSPAPPVTSTSPSGTARRSMRCAIKGDASMIDLLRDNVRIRWG